MGISAALRPVFEVNGESFSHKAKDILVSQLATYAVARYIGLKHSPLLAFTFTVSSVFLQKITSHTVNHLRALRSQELFSYNLTPNSLLTGKRIFGFRKLVIINILLDTASTLSSMCHFYVNYKQAQKVGLAFNNFLLLQGLTKLTEPATNLFNYFTDRAITHLLK